MRLLLIEDDKKVAAFIVKGLTESGYIVDVRHDGRSGLEATQEESYDLIILDWMLPVIDGITVCKKIREFSKNIPILFLTAKETPSDKVKGLDAGADDFLSKPFAFMELLARIRALLRRGTRTLDKLVIDDLEINVNERKVVRGGKTIELSNKEFAILEYMVRNKNRLINRATLTEHVWNIDFDRGTNLIDVYINYLRKKLDVGSRRQLIHTVRGAGYVLKKRRMSLSLKTKFIIVFVVLGLFMSAVTAFVFYLSFNKLIREKMQSDLTNESQEFADFVRYENGRVAVELSKEWQELEHLKNTEYSRYIIVTDTNFHTLHKSENLGELEFQNFFQFRPTAVVESFDIEMDSVKYFCVVYPIRKSERIIGYVLAAENYQRTNYFIELFERTILFSLFVLILISLAVAVFFANRVTKPLLEIQHVAGGIDLLSPGKRIELSDTEKEIENLSNSLNRLFDRLERSFSQINEFSSNVSHELRTPLTILRGNIEVGLSKDRTTEEYVEILSELLEETIHIIRIVDDLLLLARADAHALRIQKEKIGLKGFCDEYSKDWEMICALRKQPLRCDHKSDFVLEADKNLLYQLILNLISNASKFTTGPEPIDLSVKKVLAENEKKYYAEITVTDRGIGISEADQEKVFDRFYRANKDRSRETGGTGLGLSICKMIVDLHEGTISLKSKPGKGTTVTVRIPATNNGELR